MKKIKFILFILIFSLITITSPTILFNNTNATIAEAASIKLNKSQKTLIKGQTLQLKVSGTKKKDNMVIFKQKNLYCNFKRKSHI